MPSVLHGTTMISTCSTFQSCRLNISGDLQRQGKCSDSCTRLVNPLLVPAVATDDQPGPFVFSAVTKKFDIATQNLQVPPVMQKKTKKQKQKQKKLVNSNQSNYTTENNLHIAGIIIISNNGYLILKIYVMY